MNTQLHAVNSTGRAAPHNHLRPAAFVRSVGILFLALLTVPNALRADCNLSGNVVGYVNLPLPATPGDFLIANPLNGPNNHLNTILPLPDTAAGTTILRWNPAIQTYGDPIIFIAGVGWDSDNPDPSWLVLNPGEGVFMQKPASPPLTVTFVGEVPEGTLATPIPAGLSCLASMVPQARPLGQSGVGGTLQFPAVDEDMAYLWNTSSQAFEVCSFFGGIWDPTDPTIGVAQGFMAQKAAPANWTRDFVVSCATGPRLAIALQGSGQVQVSWSASGWILEEAIDPEGPWTAVSGNPASPYATQPVVAMQFYRLARVACLAVNCPTNQVLDCAGLTGTPAFFTVTASNLCAGTNVPVNSTPTNGSLFALGTSTVTCVATISSETNTCTFTVTVRDNQPPLITCPPNIVVNQDPGQCSKSNVTYTVTATDVCAGTNVTVVCSPPSSSTFPIGTTPVTCWATDTLGNSNSCTFTVTVRNCGPNPCTNDSYTITVHPGVNLIANQLDRGGNTLPEILPVVPPGTVFWKLQPCAPVPVWLAVATNTTGTNWIPDTERLTPGEGASLEILSGRPPLPLTFTGRPRCSRSLPVRLVEGWQVVSDQLPEWGNIASIVGAAPLDGTQVYRMGWGIYTYTEPFGWDEEPVAQVGEAWLLYWPLDNQPPVISCSDVEVIHDPGQCSRSNVTYRVSAFDSDCSGVTLTCSPTNGSTFPLGRTPVTCWAIDAAGNSNRCTFNVVVKELEIALGSNPGETVVTWPECTDMRLESAESLRAGGTTAWWDIPGATSPYLDRTVSLSNFQARLTCGQVVPLSEECLPLVAWGYNGLASCTLAGKLFTVQLQFWTSDTNSLSIHICGPAKFGANTNTLYDLASCPVTLGTDGWYRASCPLILVEGSGGFTIAQQVDQLGHGLWYITINTELLPNGEIRGQLQPVPRYFGAMLTCDQMVPPSLFCDPLVAWGYNGQASCALDGGQFTVQLTFWISDYVPGLTSILLHGPAGGGTNAPVLYRLTDSCPISLDTNGWYHMICPLTLRESAGGYTIVQQVEQLRAGMWYITISGEFNQGGEIRGQLQPTHSRFFRLVKP
jgi:hypothetical protein